MKIIPRFLFSGGSLALTALLVASAPAATLVYDFDTVSTSDIGDDLDGWIHTLGSSSPAVYAGEGGRGADRTNGEDGVHPNMVLSSPAFFLDGSGDLTFKLNGGQGGGDVAATTFYTNLLGIPVAESTTTGLQYVALRRVSDGQYLINVQRTGADNSWQAQTITQAALAPLVSATEAYQLDLIETRHGGWGHTEIDDVTIPGVAVPEPSSAGLLGLGTLLLARRRRSCDYQSQPGNPEAGSYTGPTLPQA